MATFIATFEALGYVGYYILTCGILGVLAAFVASFFIKE